MAVTTYDQWVADGSPWHPATPVDELARTLRGHGYTVYVLGDRSHLTAKLPEDHAPYSHTPWPGPQPYPAVLAGDIMPGGPVPLAVLGARLVADRQAGRIPWLKYINWTDASGQCWHDSWQPTYARRPSSDRGHIHFSVRTDYVTASTGGYDPTLGGTVMGNAQTEDIMNRTINGVRIADILGREDSVNRATPETLARIEADVAALRAESGTVGLTDAQVEAIGAHLEAALGARLTTLENGVATLLTALRAAGTAAG